VEPEDMTAAVAASMKDRTGRSLAQWVTAVQESGMDPLDQKAVRRWLKDVHGVPQNSQWAIAFSAAEAAGWVRPSADGYTDSLYAGGKAALRPLHDAVLGIALSLGEDVEPQGRGTYIPLVRKSQFAAIAPGPKGTLRVGFRYRATVPNDPRLEPARGFAQATHWVHLPGDTGREDVGWLEPLLAEAYRQNG
jgi:Domain of unknown function (DUF5655)/Domain of unknown function (DUF4287)